VVAHTPGAAARSNPRRLTLSHHAAPSAVSAVAVVAVVPVACRNSFESHGIPVMEAHSHMGAEPARTWASAAGAAVVPVEVECTAVEAVLRRALAN
jgi:hypothetical protein